jgi:putative membrane protein
MVSYWLGPQVAEWLWILPLTLLAVCLVFLVAFLVRGPRWFYGRENRHVLHEAAREILDRRYASGEITREQYEEMKRVIAG